ncbi:SOS response-associated peptidase family protein, partial [Phytoactinopolyspora endophytica]|uniref:SOS response-associated peptidase family protein n=1 Tax=Phytoactinopolyspora endophytica TaxID=1642495 RepID=UPI00197C1421
ATSEWLSTYSVITTSPTDDVGHLHDRMPMVLRPAQFDEWLDPHNTDTDQAHTMMAPPATGSLEGYTVSKAVGNVKTTRPN